VTLSEIRSQTSAHTGCGISLSFIRWRRCASSAARNSGLLDRRREQFECGLWPGFLPLCRRWLTFHLGPGGWWPDCSGQEFDISVCHRCPGAPAVRTRNEFGEIKNKADGRVLGPLSGHRKNSAIRNRNIPPASGPPDTKRGKKKKPPPRTRVHFDRQRLN